MKTPTIGDDKLMQQMNEVNFEKKLWWVWATLWFIFVAVILWTCAGVGKVLGAL